MTEQTNEMDFELSPSAVESPGAMLKRAREARKLSHIDVAKELKLRVQWIVDIENDQYADSAALIYVQGYLRSFARLVGISPEQVLSAFSALKLDESLKARDSDFTAAGEQFVRQQPVLSHSKAKKSSTGRFSRWVTAAVLVAVIILVVLWWRGQHVGEMAKSPEPMVSIPQQSELSSDHPSALSGHSRRA